MKHIVVGLITEVPAARSPICLTGCHEKQAEAAPKVSPPAKVVPDVNVAFRSVDDQSKYPVVAATKYDASRLFLLPEIVEAAFNKDVVMIPGALTPAEVIAVWKAGADFVKIYPAEPIGGALNIRSLNLRCRK